MRRSVRKHRQIVAAAARRPYAGLRLAVTLLALIAFGFQSYLVQTHIHGLPQLAASADGKQHVSPLSRNDKAPAQNGQANCPLCQDSLRAGSYVLPPIIATLPPTLVVTASLIAIVPSLAAKSVSHIWQSRGPPLA